MTLLENWQAMHQLAKYGIGDLQVVNLKSDQDNELLETITKEFDEVNGIVDTILKQFSEIDSSIREWSNQFYDFASDCVDFVGKLSEASDSSNRDPCGLTCKVPCLSYPKIL